MRIPKRIKVREVTYKIVLLHIRIAKRTEYSPFLRGKETGYSL